jgi:uncharacterized protein YeaO (DUF488 family)
MRIKLGRCKVDTGGDVEVPMHAACSEWGLLVPTWPMVKGYKNKTLDIPGYLEQYEDRLRRCGKQVARKLYRVGVTRGGVILLSCYCRDTAFCHTYYLVKYLVETYPEGFEIHPDIKEFVEGLDWAGEVWERKDPVSFGKR